MTQKETFGQVLRRLRNDRKWTLRDLEKKIGVKYAYLSQLEAGLAKPSEELAKRLANLFKEDEEKFIFLARDIPKVINDLKKKFPKQAPLFFRKALDKGGKE